MKKTIKIKPSFYLLLIFVGALLMSIGYATMNSAGEIKVLAEATAPNSLYISDASVNDPNSESFINTYYQTMFASTSVLSKTDASSTVSYTITFYNNTSLAQEFSGITYDPAFYDNENITYELTGLAPGDKIESKASVTVTLTFHYVDNVLNDNNILNSYLNFEFKKKYSVKYVNITDSVIKNNNYPTIINDGEALNITLNNITKIEITMGNKILVVDTDYTFNNNVLNIPTVTGDLVITVPAVSTPVINENGQYFEGSSAPGNNGSVKVDGWVGDVYNLVFGVNGAAFGTLKDYKYTVKVVNNTEYAWTNVDSTDKIVEAGTGIWGGNPLQVFTTSLSPQPLNPEETLTINPGETLTITFNVSYRTSLYSTASGQTIVKFNVNGEEKQLELNIKFEQN